jgi:hypothetical protein
MAVLVVAAASASGAFGAAGAVSTAVYTAAAYAAASYLDSLWISQLTRPDPIEGPKMGSLRLNTSDEGDPVQEPYGRACRVAGHVLDVSELIERRNTTVQNGKGGSGAEFTEFTYSCHAMISFGLGPAEDITKIRANGKTIWSKYPTINISSSSITGTVVQSSYQWGASYAFANTTWNNTAKTLTFTTLKVLEPYNTQALLSYTLTIVDPQSVGLAASANNVYVQTGVSVVISGAYRTYTFQFAAGIGGTSNGQVSIILQFETGDTSSDPLYWYLTLESTSPNADLSEIQVGGGKLSIVQPSANGGSFTVIDSGVLSNGNTFCKVRHNQVLFDFAAGTAVTLQQINPAFSGDQMAEAPNMHRGPLTGLLGADDAPVDELFEALRAPRIVPAYRGKIVVTFKGLQLFDFGNTLPQFEADVVQAEQSQLRDYVSQVCLDAGMLEDEFDADALSQPLLGLAMRGPQDAREKLAPVMMAYELVTSESDGRIKFTHRNNVPQYDVLASDLSAREIGADTIRPVTFSDLGDEPADAVVVTYRSSARDYTTTVAQCNRRAETPRSTQRIDLSVLQMEAEDAQKLATHIAYLAPVNRRQVEFTLPVSYVDRVREGVRVNIPVNGRVREVLVMSVTRGPNGVLEVIGVLEQSSIFDMDVDTYQPPSPELAFVGTEVNGFGSATLDVQFLNLPPLRDEHRNKIGFYAAACSTSRLARFPGALIYQALDEFEEEWRAVGRIPTDSVMGQCMTILGGAVEGIWDETSTLDVLLTSGTLESVTELACLNGRNRALVGLEIIGFRSAELIDTHTYRLSGLLRGLRQTELEISDHIPHEQFVLLTGTGLEFIELENAAQGMTRAYKVLTPGARLPEASSFSFIASGASSQCFAPINMRGTRDASNNLTIEWTRVSRANVRLLSQQAIPMAEPFERYEVEISDASNNLLRTMVVAAPFVVYTAAQQTADGITPGNTVLAFVRQLGDIVHAGRTRGAAL